MKIGFVIYGSLDTVSGGYLYDRKLVEYLRAQSDTVEIISLPWRNYAAHLTDNFRFRLPSNLDVLIQDELNHPSLIGANQGKHPYPVVSLVHHLRCSEMRPQWQNDLYRVVEKKYLQSVDGFIFNSKTTRGVVNDLIGDGKPSVLAYPPTDRFADSLISEKDIKERAQKNPLKILFLGNVIERKGLHILLDAFFNLNLVSLNQTFILDIIGSLDIEREYVRKMQDSVKGNYLNNIITFHSTLDQEHLIEKLKQAHILVVPSSYEGFGIVYLEGMGFGLPAIGTTSGAAGEIITDSVDGFLIRPYDFNTLTKHLKTLNENRDILTRMSLAARVRYLAQPQWDKTAKGIRKFLIRMIS